LEKNQQEGVAVCEKRFLEPKTKVLFLGSRTRSLSSELPYLFAWFNRIRNLFRQNWKDMVRVASISIRRITTEDEPFLWEMLYQALYVSEGSEPFPSDIVQRPEISRYVQSWGQSGDDGVIAVDKANDRPVGAAWLRLLRKENRGYGYVNDETPELSIAVAPEHRGKGVGTKLLTELLTEAETRYSAVSLSVSVDNPAVRLYERMGFEVVWRSGNSITMIKIMDAV
jgi:ribosomal protein S18 acetylase RimI-like enzyme